MAEAYTYAVATNTVVCTGGTSGTPSTFAGFVTADRAGTGTSLKAATAASKTLTLTYPVRPVELLAIVVKCIVASKTTSTDYIYISGHDAWGTAQTESIDVSAGNGTYTSTKRWSVIDNLSCDDAVDGSGTVWADGTLAVTQDIWGVIWNTAYNTYFIDCIFTVGDGSTSTVFAETKKAIIFKDVFYLAVKAAATYQQGTKNGATSGTAGGLLAWRHSSTTDMGNTNPIWAGTVLLYGVLIADLGVNLPYKNPKFTISGASSEFISVYCHNIDNFNITNSSTLTGIEFHSCATSFLCEGPTASPIISDLSSRYGVYGAAFQSAPTGGVTVRNLNLSNSTTADLYMTFTTVNKDYTFIDATYTGVVMPTNTGSYYAQYTCNINVCDKNGTAIAGAVVDCVDTTATAVWTAGSVTTDASGNITEQNISFKRYYYSGGSQTTTYSPHKFTISKPGYQTLVLENITVSAPIKWHLELQRSYLRAGRSRRDLNMERG